jgi:hypothetical protein
MESNNNNGALAASAQHPLFPGGMLQHLLNEVSPSGAQGGLVLKDRLLTDSVVANGEEFPVMVKSEHSYSIGMGSDGDSLPSSPLSSLQDGKRNSFFLVCVVRGC